MNRRSFFSTLGKAVAGFTILPPATTYCRVWRATRDTKPPWVLEWKSIALNNDTIYRGYIPGPLVIPIGDRKTCEDLILAIAGYSKQRYPSHKIEPPFTIYDHAQEQV